MQDEAEIDAFVLRTVEAGMRHPNMDRGGCTIYYIATLLAEEAGIAADTARRWAYASTSRLSRQGILIAHKDYYAFKPTVQRVARAVSLQD